jgi:hypothetical protein
LEKVRRMPGRGANRYILSHGEHFWSGRDTVTSVTTTDLVLSGLTGSAYNGMRLMMVKDNSAGGNEGKIYNVVSNTTTNITLQEGAADWGASDVFVVEVRNAAPTVRNVFLDVVEDFEFPTTTIEGEEYHTLNTGQDRHAYVAKRFTYNASLPTIVKDFRFPFYLFGQEICQGTVQPTTPFSQALTAAAKKGDTVLTVGATTNLTVGEYITIGFNDSVAPTTIDEYPETRKVTVLSPLTIDAPLRYNHAITTTICKEVIAPFYHFVFCAERTMTGVDSGAGGSTLSAGVFPTTTAGSSSITLTDATGYAIGDYIQVGTTINPEIRQVVGVSSNTLTLDSPLRFNHLSGATCNEVAADTVANPWVQTVTEYAEVPGFDLVGVYTDAPTLVRDALFTKITSGNFSSEAGDLLKFTAELNGSDVITTGSAPTVGATNTTPYQYRHVTGGINVNGVTYANIEQFGYTLARSITPYYTHQTTTGSKPFWLCEGKRTHEIGMTLIPANNNFHTLLDGSTRFVVDMTFTRGTNDTLSFYFRDVVLPAAPHGMTIDGPVRVGATLNPGWLLFAKIVDNIPYYPNGGV